MMLATAISANRCLENWVNGVASTGIFVKNIDATWTTTGASGVPTNWTVIYYDPSTGYYYLSDKTTRCDDHGNPLTHDYSLDPFTIVAQGDGTITIDGGTYDHYDSEMEGDAMAWYPFEYSDDGGVTWQYAQLAEEDGYSEFEFDVQTGDTIMLRCDVAAIMDDADNSGFQNPV